MCYTEQTWVPTLLIGLETFLGGMETVIPYILRVAARALKPSLVEWKRVNVRVSETRGQTLKPSLVEWKPNISSRRTGRQRRLETFLGGMETEERGATAVSE